MVVGARTTIIIKTLLRGEEHVVNANIKPSCHTPTALPQLLDVDGWAFEKPDSTVGFMSNANSSSTEMLKSLYEELFANWSSAVSILKIDCGNNENLTIDLGRMFYCKKKKTKSNGTVCNRHPRAISVLGWPRRACTCSWILQKLSIATLNSHPHICQCKVSMVIRKEVYSLQTSWWDRIQV